MRWDVWVKVRKPKPRARRVTLTESFDTENKGALL